MVNELERVMRECDGLICSMSACLYVSMLEHIGRLVRMSVLDTEVDGSNPGSSMLFP